LKGAGRAAAVRVDMAAFLAPEAGEKAPGGAEEIELCVCEDRRWPGDGRAAGCRGPGRGGEDGDEQEEDRLTAKSLGHHGGSWRALRRGHHDRPGGSSAKKGRVRLTYVQPAQLRAPS
jgi:hypothetical protein